MQAVVILAALSAAGMLTVAKAPHTEALNIIKVRKASKRRSI
jgi:hypothetical protein